VENELVFSMELISSLVVVLAVCILLPVFYIIYYTFRKKISLLSIVFGIVGFLAFGYILSGFLLGTIAPADSAAEGPVRYALLRGLCVAVAEGGGAFVAMLLLRRRGNDLSAPISYGLGYPLISLFAVGGANSFIRLGEAYTVNEKGLAEVLASVEGEAVEVLRQELFALAEMPAYKYYLSAADYVCVFLLCVAICRIMWYAAAEQGQKQYILLGAGLLFKFITELALALYQGGATTNFVLCEVLYYGFTLLCVGFAVLVAFRYDEKEKVSAGPLNRRLL